jgi:hypothetical protein
MNACCPDASAPLQSLFHVRTGAAFIYSTSATDASLLACLPCNKHVGAIQPTVILKTTQQLELAIQRKKHESFHTNLSSWLAFGQARPSLQVHWQRIAHVRRDLQHRHTSLDFEPRGALGCVWPWVIKLCCCVMTGTQRYDVAVQWVSLPLEPHVAAMRARLSAALNAALDLPLCIPSSGWLPEQGDPRWVVVAGGARYVACPRVLPCCLYHPLLCTLVNLGCPAALEHVHE